MPEFYITFARRKYFPGFWGCSGGGQPVSYAYGWAPGPHQLNPALLHRRLVVSIAIYQLVMGQLVNTSF